MTTATHTTIVCDNCDAKLRVKPGLLKVMKVIKCTKCKHAIRIADITPVETEEPAAPPPPPAPALPADTDDAQFVTVDSGSAPEPSDTEELENLRIQLNAAKHEIAELDERVSSLQELYQGKEVEIREMADRLQKAQDEAARAVKLREDFLARIKKELAVYLVEEREAALARFSELESRLMKIDGTE